MARLDYYQIELDMQTALKANAGLAGVTVDVERDVNFGESDSVVIYLRRRDAPSGMQAMNAGTRTRFLVHIELYCMSCHLEMATARRNRDNLLGKVELACMADRTFANAQVATSWIEGGEFEDGRGGTGFYSLGTIRVVLDASAIS